MQDRIHMSSLKDHVLVLNAQWQAVGVSTVKKIVTKMFRGNCRYIDMYQKDEFSAPSFMEHPLVSDEEHSIVGWIDVPAQPGQKFITCKRGFVVAPEVVKFESYKKMPKMKVRFSRQNILIRDGGICQYCGDPVVKRVSDKSMYKLKAYTLDHVHPRSRGGRHAWDNVVTCCSQCNNKKADRTPDEAKMKLLSVPVEPKWNIELMKAIEKRPASWDHFFAKADKAKESVGRATKKQA